MSDLNERLAEFRREVHMHLAFGMLADIELDVVDEEGAFPVVAALGEERLAVLLKRVANSGGYATVFIDNGENGVHVLPFIDASCALDSDRAEDLATDENRPGATSTVSMFLSYLELKPHGVRLPSRLDGGERPIVQSPRAVSFQPA